MKLYFFPEFLALLLLATLSCKNEAPQVSETRNSAVPLRKDSLQIETHTQKEWNLGHSGEISCVCEMESNMWVAYRYHVIKSQIHRVELARTDSLDNCVQAKIEILDTSSKAACLLSL